MLYKIQIIALSLSVIACSSLSQNNHQNQEGQSVFTSQTRSVADAYDNHKVHTDHPSPTSPNLDNDVSLKSKADYHFTLSEIYSASNNSQKAITELEKTLTYDPKSVTVLLKLAYEYLKSGDITKSIESAHSVLEIDPKNQKATIFLGGLYMSLKMYAQAEAQYRQTLSHYSTNQPESLEIALYLGISLIHQEKKDKEAIGIFQNITEHSDQHRHTAYYYLGHIQQQKADLFKAEKYYKESLKTQKDFKIAAIALAGVYEQTNRLVKAIELLKSFQKKNGTDEQIALYLAKIYIHQQDYENAYLQYEIITAFRPNDHGFQMRLAFILIKQKKYKDALSRLQGLLDQGSQTDRIHFYIGAIYEETKDYAKAVAEFLKIPTSSLYYNEARIYAAYLENKQKHPEKAVQILEEATTSKPKNAKLIAVYASLLNDLKQYDKAIKFLKVVIEDFPKDQQLHFILGSLYDKVNNKEETIRIMKYVLSLNSQHVEALNYLAYTYAEMNKELDEAELLARRALSLKPNDGYIQDTLGWIMFKQGHIENSIKLLESAYKVESDERIIAEHLGDAYHKNNLLGKALEMYKKAYEIETENTEKSKIQSKINAIRDAASQRIPASQATDSSK